MGIIQKPEEASIRGDDSAPRTVVDDESAIPFIPAFDLLKESETIPCEHVAAIGVALWKILGGTKVPPSRWSAEGAAKRT